MCILHSLGVLVDVHGAVESLQLSHQQLQVGVDVAQLQQDHLLDLVVRCGPARTKKHKKRYARLRGKGVCQRLQLLMIKAGVLGLVLWTTDLRHRALLGTATPPSSTQTRTTAAVLDVCCSFPPKTSG